MPHKRNVIAAIPAYNEASRIGPVIRKALEHVDEVVVVDDHSRDDTLRVATDAGATAVRLVTNMGAGFATRVACDAAVRHGADVIVTIDADGQHDPAEIPRIVKMLEDRKVDVVFGARPRDVNMPLFKRIGNGGLSFICRILFGIRITDSQTGFHAFTPEGYRKIRWISDRYGMVSEIVANVARNKASYAEAPIKTIYVGKVAGMGVKDAIKAVMSMISWRLRRW